MGRADPGSMYVAYGYKGRPGYGYVFPKADCVDFGVGYMLPPDLADRIASAISEIAQREAR